MTFSTEVLNGKGFSLLQSNLHGDLINNLPAARKPSPSSCTSVLGKSTYGCQSSIMDRLRGNPNRRGAPGAIRPRRRPSLQPPPSPRGPTSPILCSDGVVLPSACARGAERLQPRWSLLPGPSVQGSCISGRSGRLQAWPCAWRLCCCGWRK